MKTRLILLIIFLSTLGLNAQDVILGTSGFLTKNPLGQEAGFGFYTRGGLSFSGIEVGVKTFYGQLGNKLSKVDSYGASLYSFVPIYRLKKWEAAIHVEAGFSVVKSEFFLGEEWARQTGIGPRIGYQLKEYFNIELILEYVLFSSGSKGNRQYNRVFIPTIGWSVSI